MIFHHLRRASIEDYGCLAAVAVAFCLGVML